MNHNWYPVLVDGLRFLAYAKVDAEAGEIVDLATVLSLDASVRFDSDSILAGLWAVDTDEWTDEAWDRFEAHLVDVATNAAHPSWQGFMSMHGDAFPKATTP